MKTKPPCTCSIVHVNAFLTSIDVRDPACPTHGDARLAELDHPEVHQAVADKILDVLNPAPGSIAAGNLGCLCPVLDNAHGRGYLGGVKDRSGKTVYVIRDDCPMHGIDAMNFTGASDAPRLDPGAASFAMSPGMDDVSLVERIARAAQDEEEGERMTDNDHDGLG